MKTIYYGGHVFTGALPLEQAFSVEEGMFRCVGSNELVLDTKEPGDQLVDLEGQFVCAGFNDSHMHMLNYGYSLECCDLVPHTGSLSELKDALRSFIRENDLPAGTWVIGRGWNQDYFSDVRRLPDRYDLDQISLDHPISITRCCGHCLCVNSKALSLIGIGGETVPDTDGQVDLDELGNPTGIFWDNAMNLVSSHFPKPGREDILRMLHKAATRLSSYGITSVQSDDFCAFDGLDYETVIEAYQTMTREGSLPLRVNEQCQFMTEDSLSRFLEKGYNTGWGDHQFRIGPLKMVGDGSLGARTALLSMDYADAPGERGLALFTQEQFDRMVSIAHSNGMQVAIHTIGDGILDHVLTAYEHAFAQWPRPDHRSGIVHAQIMRPDQLERMQKIGGMHAYIQSIFLDYDSRIVKERTGEELSASSYAFHSLRKLGLHVSNGTDCPVEDPNPLRGIQCAVTRRPLDGSLPPYLPWESMDVEEAFQSYTAEGAWASFEENIKGRISPGMLADFVMLSGNPFSVSADSIAQLRVVGTWFEGKRVYGDT